MVLIAYMDNVQVAALELTLEAKTVLPHLREKLRNSRIIVSATNVVTLALPGHDPNEVKIA